MHRKSTTITLSDLNSSQNSNSKMSNSTPCDEEGEVRKIWAPADYIKRKADYLLSDLSSNDFPNQRIMIIDYFKDPKFNEVMTKFKALNARKNALEKRALAAIPMRLEVEFHKSQRESFLSIFFPEQNRTIKRSRSAIQNPVSQKPSLKKTNERKHGQSATRGDSGNKKPQRYSDTLKNQKREKSGSVDSMEGWSPLRKELNNSRGKQSQFNGNFLRLEALLNFIFLKENDPEPISSDFSSVDKLKRILLICYETVTDSHTLLSEIIKRFWVLEEGKASSSDNISVATTNVIQIDLLNFIRTWVRERTEDFQHDEATLAMLKRFLTTVSLKLKTDFGDSTKSIRHLVDKIKPVSDAKSHAGHSKVNDKSVSKLSPKTRSYFSQIHKEINFLGLQNIQEIFMIVPAFEIAKQFCLFDLKLASQFKLHHLKESSKDKSNILNPITQAGLHFSYFTLFLIFLFSKIEKKGPFVSRLVCVANSLYELRNYQGFAIIMTALTHSYIRERMNKILQEIDKDLYELKCTLEALFDKETGNRTLKKTISQASFPMVPFMPLVITDILKIDALHKDASKGQDSNDLSVNLDKLEMTFDTYENTYLVKYSNYDFEPLKIFQDFLDRYYREVLFSYTGTHDIDEIEDILFRLNKETQ